MQHSDRAPRHILTIVESARVAFGLMLLTSAGVIARPGPAPDRQPVPTYFWRGGEGRDLNGDGVRDLVWFMPYDVAGNAHGVIAVGDARTGEDIIRFPSAAGPTILEMLRARSPLDLNDDQVVDGADLTLLLQRIGAQGPPRGPGDVNADGIVDGRDLDLLMQGINGTGGSAWVDVLEMMARQHPEAAAPLAAHRARTGRHGTGAGNDGGAGGCMEIAENALCEGGGGGGPNGGPGGGSGGGSGGFNPPGGGPGLPDQGR